MATEKELSLTDYLSVLKRRWPVMLGIFSLILLAAIALALLLPKVYESGGSILVESSIVPEDVVKGATTAMADDMIKTIQRRVLTSYNLNILIKKYNLYSDSSKALTSSDLIAKMRENIFLVLQEGSNQNQWGVKPTIAFDVSFQSQNPDIAHKVATDLMTLILDDNVKSRTKRATETTEFLTQEADTLKKDLEAVENRVAVFKQEHADSLPEHMEMHMSMLQSADQAIKDLDRDYKSTQEELRYLDVELASATAGGKKGGNTETSIVSELDKAKAELERSLVLYKDTHPTIRALKRKIETLEKSTQAPAGDAPVKTDIATDLVVAKIKAQIEAAKSRLNSYEDQKASFRAKMNQLQNQVTKSPQVESGLFTLMRDYENAKLKYEEVKSKQINAKIAENLEQENKSERFTVLVAPTFPDYAVKPERKKIVAKGLLVAIAAAIALAGFLELLDKRVRSVDALTAILNIRPLVVIPYIYTQNEIIRKKNTFKYVLMFICIFLLISLILIHFLVAPLDILLAKAMSKVG